MKARSTWDRAQADATKPGHRPQSARLSHASTARATFHLCIVLRSGARTCMSTSTLNAPRQPRPRTTQTGPRSHKSHSGGLTHNVARDATPAAPMPNVSAQTGPSTYQSHIRKYTLAFARDATPATPMPTSRHRRARARARATTCLLLLSLDLCWHRLGCPSYLPSPVKMLSSIDFHTSQLLSCGVRTGSTHDAPIFSNNANSPREGCSAGFASVEIRDM